MGERWGRRLFTAGAGILLALGGLHSLSLLEKPVPENETEKQLMELMSGYRFNLMGSMRSADDLLRGFSICFSVGAIAVGVLGIALRRERAGLLKRVAGVNAVWLAALNAVSFRYFFAAPTAFLVAALVMFALAWIQLPGDGH